LSKDPLTPTPSPENGKGSFPLLHFLLPPGEENRGLCREREIRVMIILRLSGQKEVFCDEDKKIDCMADLRCIPGGMRLDEHGDRSGIKTL
jgi:hypothetical protein